ncbi:2326_t:CDS:2 [Funneliformis geosporum]|uniref:2326_t:CDS:1 n=1 Tax=Funneliformis geosporum TaxID=1117311 RepID=A0A9W4T2P9_9GLOM|nr:2326_t:CDS:2 [Funneliformis geosporum]
MGILLLLALAIYYLTHENQDRKTQRQLKAEQAQEERLLRRMEPNPALIQAKKAKKQKQATLLIALVLIGGLAYYFLGYLPEERQRAKEEIEQMFKDNWNVTAEKLDKAL